MRPTIFAAVLTMMAGLLISGSCGHVVIRDPAVYANQIHALNTGAAQMSQVVMEHAAAMARKGDVLGCVEFFKTPLTKNTLAINSRAPYHAAMAMFLGEMAPDPGDPPPVPSPERWCLKHIRDGTITGTTTYHTPIEQPVDPLPRTNKPRVGRGLVRL